MYIVQCIPCTSRGVLKTKMFSFEAGVLIGWLVNTLVIMLRWPTFFTASIVEVYIVQCTMYIMYACYNKQ